MGNLRASCKLSADFACSKLPDAFQHCKPFSLGFSLVHYLQIKFPNNFLSASAAVRMVMNRFYQLESLKLRFARGRSVLVQVALSLFIVSMLGGVPSVFSTLRACCEEGSEEVRVEEEQSIAVAHRRDRQKSLETKRRRLGAFQYSLVAPRVLGASTTHALDRSTPAQFLPGAGIRIRC